MDYHELFNDSYERAVASDSEEFFSRFYEIFIASDARIPDMFSATDMKQQRRVLMASLMYLIDLAVTNKPGKQLMGIAGRHGIEGMNIPRELYDNWMESLLQTVSECDPRYDKDTEMAWRVLLAPGVAYMKTFSNQ